MRTDTKPMFVFIEKIICVHGKVSKTEKNET